MPPERDSDDLPQLLDAPAQDEYALLELELDWHGSVGVEAQLAAAVRLFVITRDPLDWLDDRGHAWATANADGDTLELPIYITRQEVHRRTAGDGGEPAEVLGAVAGTALAGATTCQASVIAGAYPDLAFRRQIPRLLDGWDAVSELNRPTVTIGSSVWEPMGLAAVQDLVQDAFGRVDLDRSAVRLEPAASSRPDCPACRGRRFGFPADLGEAQSLMCDQHRSRADAITADRISRAHKSNPAGWRALGKGSARTSGVPDPLDEPRPQRHRSSVGRNDPCPCGSGRKYKNCCGR